MVFAINGAVTLGLDPRVQPRGRSDRSAWMLGSSPSMTAMGLGAER